MLLNRPSSKAFTLLELVVVLVVLAVLATLAIPTFARVIERSRDAKTLTTLRAVARNAQALAAFEERDVQAKDLETAGDETSAPSASGVLAAQPGRLGLKEGVLLATTTTLGQLVSGGSGTVTLRPSADRLCAVGFTRTVVSVGSCMPVTGSTSSSDVVSAPNVSVPGVAPETVPVSAVPGPPGAAAASAVTSSSFTVSWSAPASAGGSVVLGYEVYIDGALATPTPAGAITTTSASFTGLAASKAHSVTIRARNASGLGVASAPLAVTTSAAVVTYGFVGGKNTMAFRNGLNTATFNQPTYDQSLDRWTITWRLDNRQWGQSWPTTYSNGNQSATSALDGVMYANGGWVSPNGLTFYGDAGQSVTFGPVAS